MMGRMADTRGTRSLRRVVLLWLVLSAGGVLVLSVPDDGPRVVAFSEHHGPSALDAVGILILLAGWAAFLAPLVAARHTIHHASTLALVALAGAVLVIWSVTTDAGAWWVLGVVTLVAVQLMAAFLAIKGGAVRARRSSAGPRPPTG
jgi:hypothetical protein